MKKRNVPQNKKTAQRVPRREGDPIPWRYCFLTLICGVILVGGLFLAARQHFSAINYGIKNAKLRQEKENLETRKLSLKYTRETALSHEAIRKAARKYGFREMTASNIDTSDRKPPEKTKPETSSKPPAENANKETAKTDNKDEKKPAKTAAKEETKKTETKTDKKKDAR